MAGYAGTGQDFFRLAQERIEEFRGGGCLINVDIKNYKTYVDLYGVDAGRDLLLLTAETLREYCERGDGLFGHAGQDQFCLLVPFRREQIRALQEKLQTKIDSITPIEGFIPYFGIALIDDSSDQILEFFNRAALTTDEIKENVYTRTGVYDPQNHRKNARKREILIGFQHAIERGEVMFFLQPQFRIPGKKIVGAEALARWRREDGDWVSPAEFVPVLENYGLVHRLDLFIWEEVCKWMRSWIDRGHTAIPVSVNISREDIAAVDVPQTLEKLLEKYDLTADVLQIEITETAYKDNMNPVNEVIRTLRRKGFCVMMDDFGSGYSSLSMLRSIEMDMIKLDARFLDSGKNGNRKGISILESVVNMTRNLTTPIIVEGVETEHQARFLSGLGCTYMQGFYFARPMTVERFEDLASEEGRIDDQGFAFKANQEMRVREFYDENIYSDTMLNNILGPVAFYNLAGDSISIIRYNEQFFELTGVTEREMQKRSIHIQDYMPKEDHELILNLLRQAEEHPDTGSAGVVRAIRPNGVIVWLDLHIFFMEEDHLGKKFYVSAHDVSETFFVSANMPGAYYRTTVDHDYEFLFIGENYLKLTGYTREEIRNEFDNKQINMIHPDDVQNCWDWTDSVARGETQDNMSFRLRRKRGDYIYVVEHDQITDQYGKLCSQCMAVDINEMMVMREQMRILANHMVDTVFFVRRNGEHLLYEPVVYNMQGVLGMSDKQFKTWINEGNFFSRIEGFDEALQKSSRSREEVIGRILDHMVLAQREIRLLLPSGEKVCIMAHADRVSDRKSGIEYIVFLRRK